MKRFETLKTWSSTPFLRAVGLSLEQFLTVRDKVRACIQADQETQPLKKRGRKGIPFTGEDKRLLPLTYLRHDPPCAQ